MAVLVKIVYLQRLCSREEWLTGCLSLPSKRNGALAHLVERLVRNQKVVGSSPICSTNLIDNQQYKQKKEWNACRFHPFSLSTNHLRWAYIYLIRRISAFTAFPCNSPSPPGRTSPHRGFPSRKAWRTSRHRPRPGDDGRTESRTGGRGNPMNCG